MSQPMSSALRRSAHKVAPVFTVVALCLAAPLAGAQDNKLGGHFGMVFPIITHADGETTDIGDDFNMGFPMGITVKKSGRWAFDLELVPGLNPQDDGPIGVPLTVHPGVLYDLGSHWTLGLRMAFDINSASWGFTPLLNKGFPVDNHAFFVEFVVPIRFQDDLLGEGSTAITFGVHLGVGF
jgi:hypothetical protein